MVRTWRSRAPCRSDRRAYLENGEKQFLRLETMNAEKFENHYEGWRTLWLAIAGVMAITLTWNVLMLSLNGVSY
jgi:hypothetical protein